MFVIIPQQIQSLKFSQVLKNLNNDIGKSHNMPWRSTYSPASPSFPSSSSLSSSFISLFRVSLTSAFIHWWNWGYICFRCWQLNQSGTLSGLLSSFFFSSRIWCPSPHFIHYPLSSTPTQASTQKQSLLTDSSIKIKPFGCTQMLCILFSHL